MDASELYFVHSLAHHTWYDSLESYAPGPEYLAVAREVLPTEYLIRRYNIWFDASLQGTSVPTQGWKIHLSATPDNAAEVLRVAAQLLARSRAVFKFVSDEALLRIVNSKSWPRGSSAKFITVYPKDTAEFVGLVPQLAAELEKFDGPYVLSDRRYGKDGVVYYRYGGIQSTTKLSITGARIPMLLSPDGNTFRDERRAFWSPPSWVSDPFEIDGSLNSRPARPTLQDGRYEVKRALRFSNTGGVYLCQDHRTDTQVIIKEARPFTAPSEDGLDAVGRLRKEFRLLKKLESTEITPRPLELFTSWDHTFLVEEYVEGVHLGAFTNTPNPLYRIAPTRAEVIEALRQMRLVWLRLAEGVFAMHQHGIVCGDLSITNVLVSRDSQSPAVRLIDLEAAWEENVDLPARIYTPGFAADARGALSREDDHYSLGALILATFHPITAMLELDPTAKSRFLQAIGEELSLPSAFMSLVDDLMTKDRQRRRTDKSIIESLSDPFEMNAGKRSGTQADVSNGELLEATSRIADFITSAATPERRDRLFPADPMLFQTNALSVAWGACGVARALLRLNGEAPKAVVSWILQRIAESQRLPPGLYVGSSGVAWTLADLGYEELGAQVHRAALDDPMTFESPDVFYGASGFGLTALYLAKKLGDARMLEHAVRAADFVVTTRHEEDDGCFWVGEDGETYVGYARGASGIALFLLYAGLATENSEFVRVGRRALDFDLAQAVEVESGVLSFPRTARSTHVLRHYWFEGSAGVGTALLRYHAYSPEQTLFTALRGLVPDASRKYAIFPGLFRGLTGLGNFLLDAYLATDEAEYLERACDIYRGIKLFAIERTDGLAFPGDQLRRLSTDFGTGSAGIGLFLHRLATIETRPTNFNFVLDELISDFAVSSNGAGMSGRAESRPGEAKHSTSGSTRVQ